MLSSSRYVLLKLSKRTSPQKLFPSDCITLYDIQGNTSTFFLPIILMMSSSTVEKLRSEHDDFVWDNVNMAFRFEDNILHQIFNNQISFFIMMILIFIIINENAYSRNSKTQTQCYEFLVVRLLFYFKFNLHIKN